jgi:integral membrane protein
MSSEAVMSQSTRPQAVSSSLTRYRVLAYTTGVFLLLLTLHVIVQWRQSVSQDVPFSDADGLGKWLPGGEFWIPAGHGWLYLAYVLASLDLWMRTRLPIGRMALVVLAGTVPGMSFVAEHWVTSRVRPMVAAVVERRPEDIPSTP